MNKIGKQSRPTMVSNGGNVTKYITNGKLPIFGAAKMNNSPLLHDAFSSASGVVSAVSRQKSVRFASAVATVHYPSTKLKHSRKVNLAPLRSNNAKGSKSFVNFRSLDCKSLEATVNLFKSSMRLSDIDDGETLTTDDQMRYKRVIDEYLLCDRPLSSSKSEPMLNYLYSAGVKLNEQNRLAAYVPHYAMRILDAPNMPNDYYTNVIDLSRSNILSVGLGHDIYSCLLEKGDVCSDIEHYDRSEQIGVWFTCLKFAPDGHTLAIAQNTGSLELLDLKKQTVTKELRKSGSAIIVMSWRKGLLACGDQSGEICLFDTKSAQPNVGIVVAHSADVCGLAWSPDGCYLASSGDDCLINIFSAASVGKCKRPALRLEEHCAAVKAVAWHPYNAGILATGGGSGDQKLKIWNVKTGHCQKSKTTPAQITGLMWSSKFEELVSSHGAPTNNLYIWTYPALNVLKVLNGHVDRILSMVMSPCGEYVLTAAADESIRIWPCFGSKDFIKYHAQRGFVDDVALPLDRLSDAFE